MVAPKDSLIAFAQHSPGLHYLDQKLRHLADNGYQTITTREYHDWLAGSWEPKQPSVLLTFDDGRRGFAKAAYPLLKSYGFRCVLFVCPGLVELASRAHGALGQLSRQSVLTWDELASLHREGLVDIQSHGMWHNRVCSCSSLKGVRSRPIRSIFHVPELLPPDGRLESVLQQETPHTTRVDSRPFFACTPSESGPVTEQTIRADLASAKERIEAHLGGHSVRAFAFPWWTGTRRSTELVSETGHELAFWGLSPIHPRLGKEAVDPLRIGRLGFDWICCLPGPPGQTSVARLLYEKLRGLHAEHTRAPRAAR